MLLVYGIHQYDSPFSHMISYCAVASKNISRENLKNWVFSGQTMQWWFSLIQTTIEGGSLELQALKFFDMKDSSVTIKWKSSSYFVFKLNVICHQNRDLSTTMRERWKWQLCEISTKWNMSGTNWIQKFWTPQSEREWEYSVQQSIFILAYFQKNAFQSMNHQTETRSQRPYSCLLDKTLSQFEGFAKLLHEM